MNFEMLKFALRIAVSILAIRSTFKETTNQIKALLNLEVEK